jgi:hypothetical protein
VNSGTIHARTFSFVARSSRTAPPKTDTRQAVHQLIQEAITKNLAAKGVAKADAGSDITVGYMVIIGDNVSTERIDEYFGYGDAASDLHEKAHDIYTNSKNPNYFQAGTLVIDIVDTRTFKLLKRGYTTRSTLRNVPEDARAAKVQEAVDAILRDLRITS